MEIEDLLEEEKLWDIPEEQRHQIEVLELEEYLDNLGYIDISRNELARDKDFAEIMAGIRQFRLEYQQCYPFLQQHPEVFKHAFLPSDMERAHNDELTEEELNFLSHLSSLEGAFELHRFAKTEIRANPILTRVLNFRLSILGLMDKQQPDVFFDEIDETLSRLGGWAQVSDYAGLLELTGDVHLLTSLLSNLLEYSGSAYAHIAYFKDKRRPLPDSRNSARTTRKQKEEAFESHLGFLEESSIKKYRERERPSDIEVVVQDPLNRLMCRLAQIKLWLLGTYEGRLDSDIGPVSVQAIIGLTELIERLKEEVTDGGRSGGIFVEDIIVRRRRQYWAFNVTFLFRKVFPILIDQYRNELKKMQEGDEPEEDIKNATLAEEIHSLAEQVGEQDREVFYTELNNIIAGDTAGRGKPRRKVKTRGSKDFFRSVKVFFKKVAVLIAKGVKAVISALRDLFNWIKNGIKVLIREIKKAFVLFRKAVRFVFGRKVIRTRAGRAAVVTDYDFDFDSVTTLQSADEDVLSAHIQKNREVLQAMNSLSGFLGFALFISIHIGTGPAGWLKMGIQLIKHLAIQKFGFQRFSFPVFF